VGVPLGIDLTDTSIVYADPITWFINGSISNPSAMIFGLPGLGKSTLVCRWIIGLADRGYPPLVLGDIKGEYSALIRALGGAVIVVAPGACTINPLDLGPLMQAAHQIGGPVGESLRKQAEAQAAKLVGALGRLTRGQPLADFEETIITLAVKIAHTQYASPQLEQLVQIVENGHHYPELLRAVGGGGGGDEAAGNAAEKRYRAEVRRLLQTLLSILHGPMGVIFNGPSTIQFDLNNPGGLSVDLSAMSRADDKVLAGVMIATWAHGFSAIDAQWELAQAGLAVFHNPFIVQDELWKPMGLAPGLAGIIDTLARLNRAQGVGEVRITHSPKDADALPTRADRVTALGFAEKAGMLLTFGLSRRDLDALDATTITLTDKEIAHVTSWRTPRSFRTKRRNSRGPKAPPGAGRVLIKIGNGVGIAVQTIIVDEERTLHDTNERWATTPTIPATPDAATPAAIVNAEAH